MLEIFHISDSKEDPASALDLFQPCDGILIAHAVIPEIRRFQNILPLQNGINGGIDNRDLCLRIFFQNKSSGIEGGLHGTAELGRDTDTDHGNVLRCIRQKGFCIILNGGHGGLGIYPFSINHLLIKVPDVDFCLFLKIMFIIERHVKRYYGDILFLHQLRGQITGTVTDNMKCFCHVKNPSLSDLFQLTSMKLPSAVMNV